MALNGLARFAHQTVHPEPCPRLAPAASTPSAHHASLGPNQDNKTLGTALTPFTLPHRRRPAAGSVAKDG